MARTKKTDEKKVLDKTVKKSKAVIVGAIIATPISIKDEPVQLISSPTMPIRMSAKAKLKMRSIAKYLGIDESMVATQAANELYGRFESSMKFFGKEIVKGLQVKDVVK